MDLSSGYPFWTVRNGLMDGFLQLREDLRCDVLVVGAGITGALVAYHLAQAGMKVCVIDRRESGWGSTSASTALLQYEIDVELQDLAKQFGIDDAVLAYRSCEQAIPKLMALAGRLRGIDHRRTRSLYYASHWYHKKRLHKEAELRLQHGFKLQVLDSEAITEKFGFDAPTAILTEVAAQMDPYQMARRLLQRVTRMDGAVHVRSTMQGFTPQRGGVVASLSNGATIRCKHLVLAAGYESQDFLEQKVAKNRSSYAFVSQPLADGTGVLQDCLVWESARPYLYMRSTADGRVMVGGEDDRIDIPLRRDARVMAKAEKLAGKVNALMPQLGLEPAFAWAGTFAETDDGLPFFGTHPQHGRRVHFAMAYGGNGITYSMIGAELLRDSMLGLKHPCARLFSFDRLSV